MQRLTTVIPYGRNMTFIVVTTSLLVILSTLVTPCHGIIQTSVSATASGEVNLVCIFNNLEDDFWIAIYRTNLAYAECLFWDKATVKNAPYSCNGNFTVAISETDDGNWMYSVTILDKEKSDVVDARDYFCRTLREQEEGEGSYEQVEQGIDYITLDPDKFPLCSTSPQNLNFVDGDEFQLTCSPLGIIPVMIDWSRSDGAPVTGYTDTYDLNKMENDAEVPKGYIFFHAVLPVILNREHDGITFTCAVTSNAVSNSVNSTRDTRTCSIGPFTWHGDTTVPPPEPDTGPVLILGLGLWFFSFIVAASVLGVSIIVNILLALCLINRIHSDRYNVRKQSQRPIVPDIELEDNHHHHQQHNNGHVVDHRHGPSATQFYDAVDPGQELAYQNNAEFDDDFDADEFDEPVYGNQIF